MKNQNSGESQKLRETFVANLQELENYLNSDDSKPHKFLIADHLCEIDCTLLPRINAVHYLDTIWSSGEKKTRLQFNLKLDLLIMLVIFLLDKW